MTRRLAAVLVAAALVAAGCSGSDGPASTGDPGAGTAPATSAGQGNVPATSPADAGGNAAPMVLDNGLRLLVTPIADASSVAIMSVFDVGSHHDPPGKSGAAHFAEHLLVTAATSAEAARTVDDVVAAYPLGWNAQTGSDYTVLASVVTPDRLDAELALVAARLAGVTATVDDVERERPRVLAEVGNMFGGIADLAVVNAAKEQLLPTPHGGRRGGDPAALAAMSHEEITGWLGFYNPATVTLSIAGPVDPAAVTNTVSSLFGSIPAGPLPPPAAVPAAGSPGLAEVVTPDSSRRLVAVAYAAPVPGSGEYAAFLVAVARLFEAGPAADLVVSYAPIDDPGALVVTATMTAADTPADAAARVAHDVERIVADPLGAGEGERTLIAFGPLLGLEPNPANPYGTAFAAARAAQREDAAAGAGAIPDGAAYSRVIGRIFVDAELTGAATVAAS